MVEPKKGVVSMGWFLDAALVVAFCHFIIMPWHRERAVREGREPPTLFSSERSGLRPAVASRVRSEGRSPSLRRGQVSPEHYRLLTEAARRTDVPAGILYALWTERSGRTTIGWPADDSWRVPSELVESSPQCRGRLGRSWCEEELTSVGAICNQRRRIGQPVCNPSRIGVSPRFELGPLGHDPRDAVRQWPDGRLAWAGYVRDFNGDGVWDPLDLEEAMLSAGLRLRNDYDSARYIGGLDELAAWRLAIETYLGPAADVRYALVRDLWSDWCSVPGRCRT